MKIWVIGRGYPTPANKMWGTFELEQAKLLARGGHEVSYIALTLSFFDRKDIRGLRAFTEDGVAVHVYSHFYFPGKLGVYLEKFEDGCWRKLFAQAEKQSGLPDLIHVHYPSMITSINEIAACQKRGVRIYATEHWSRVLVNNLKKHERRRLQFYTAQASCFASVSPALEKAVRELAEVRVPTRIIPNIISPLFFRAKAPAEKSGFTYICVGRLVPLKQFDAVIRAFQQEFPEDQSARLVLIGTGSDRQKLLAMAEGDSRISLPGELPLEKVAEAIAAADVLVSFSRYETFAAPVAEAWACGRPVIVSEQSGIAPYVTAENGIVVSGERPEQLRRAMLSLRENYGKYRPQQISDYAAAHFNDEAVLAQLNAMYGEQHEKS